MLHRALVGCAVLGTVAAAASGVTVVDQANTPNPWQNNNIGALAPLGQEFVPTQTGIGFVDFRIADAGADAGPGADLQIQIRQGGIGGPLLGTSQTVHAPDGVAGYVRFPFATDVAVTPGSKYVAQVVKLSTGTGVANFMATAGQFNSYAPGDPVTSGAPEAGSPDFLFQTGRNTSAAAIASGIIQPFAYRGINDALADGTPDTLDSAAYVLANDGTVGFPNNGRAAFEYDLARFDTANVASAVLSGTLHVNNGADTGTRTVRAELYTGDGVITLGDYTLAATSAGTFSYHPPTDSSVTFSLDVTAQVRSLLAGGADFVGVRFTPVNQQAPSVFTGSDLPTLNITVPEPGTAAAALASLALFGNRRRKR